MLGRRCESQSAWQDVFHSVQWTTHSIRIRVRVVACCAAVANPRSYWAGAGRFHIRRTMAVANSAVMAAVRVVASRMVGPSTRDSQPLASPRGLPAIQQFLAKIERCIPRLCHPVAHRLPRAQRSCAASNARLGHQHRDRQPSKCGGRTRCVTIGEREHDLSHISDLTHLHD